MSHSSKTSLISAESPSQGRCSSTTLDFSHSILFQLWSAFCFAEATKPQCKSPSPSGWCFPQNSSPNRLLESAQERKSWRWLQTLPYLMYACLLWEMKETPALSHLMLRNSWTNQIKNERIACSLSCLQQIVPVCIIFTEMLRICSCTHTFKYKGWYYGTKLGIILRREE